jgi:hypothetical protein
MPKQGVRTLRVLLVDVVGAVDEFLFTIVRLPGD